MDNVIVICASGHAKVVIDILEKQGRYRVVGLVDDGKPTDQKLLGYSILGTLDALPEQMQVNGAVGGIVAIGDNWMRGQIVRRVLKMLPDFHFLTAIHPSAQIGRQVSIGPGSVVMAGAVINPDTSIGKNCIINTRASLDHDNLIGDFVSIAPGATTGGDVTIGRFTALSLGANVIHGIKIGEHTIVGAGSTVLHDLPDYVVAHGTPARVQRTRQEGDNYL